MSLSFLLSPARRQGKARDIRPLLPSACDIQSSSPGGRRDTRYWLSRGNKEEKVISLSFGKDSSGRRFIRSSASMPPPLLPIGENQVLE